MPKSLMNAIVLKISVQSAYGIDFDAMLLALCYLLIES